jgi:hypothetical protein
MADETTTETTTTTATIDVRAMREALIEDAAEKRGIAIGLCLAAAYMVRDERHADAAQDILDMDNIDWDRINQLVDANALDEYDAEPLLAMLSDAEDYG